MNLKKFKNNLDLSVNISLLKGYRPNSRVLVLGSKLEGLKELFQGYKLHDYFDFIIAENLEAAETLDWCDLLFYSQPSIFKDSVFYFDQARKHHNSLIVSNYNAIKEFKKRNQKTLVYNVNYLPVFNEITHDPHNIRSSLAGLSEDSVGVHLALIMGATEIFYSEQKHVDSEFIQNFAMKANVNGILPVNIIKPERKPLFKLQE